MTRVPIVPLSTRRVSALLSLACAGLAVMLPAWALHALASLSAAQWLEKLGVRSAAMADWTANIAAWQTGLVLLVGMLPVGAMAWALWHARGCFRCVARGEVLSHAAVRHLRGLALGLFASAACALAVPSLASFLLTCRAPPGQGAIVVSGNSQELLWLLFAAIVWRIAHVMAHAVALAEDHAQIV